MFSRIISVLWEVTIQSSLLISAVLLLRYVFRNKMNKRLQYLLWIPVLIRLFIPFSAPSRLSVMNAVAPTTEAIRRDFVVIGDPVFTNPTVMEETVSVERSFSWSNLIMCIWIIGVIAVVAVTLYCNIRFLAELKNSRKAVKAECLSEMCDELGVRTMPMLYVSDKVASPCAVGVFKQSVYLPSSQIHSPDTLRYILMHEITHIKRYDNLFAMLRSVCCAAYWFNPLVWIMARMARVDSELACDASVVSQLSKAERTAYGMALVSTLQKQSKRFAHIPVAAMTTDKKEMFERIKMIKNNKPTTKWVVICICAVMTLVVLTACTTAKAASDDTPSQDTSVFTSQSDMIEEAKPVTLLAEPDKEKVSIEVRPNEYAGNALFYVPDDETQVQIINLLQTLELQKVDSMLYLDEKLNYLGVVIWYNEEYWIVCDDGKLFAEIGDSFDWGVIDCPQLTDIVCSIAADELGLNLFFEPNQISNITSATLTCTSLNGVRYDNARFTVTDAKTLAEIEHMLSTAECLGYGGANCGFGNSLVLTTGEGNTITIGVSQDSCSSYMVDGKWYDFTAGYKDENTILYSLFDLQGI